MATWCRWNSGPTAAVLWPHGAGGRVGQLLLCYGHMVQVEQWANCCCVMAICCRWNSGPTAAVLWSYAAGGTVGHLLLCYGHMVQVEHNRAIQQGNICINITEACVYTQYNYMYSTFNLYFTFQGTPISLTVLTLNNKTQFLVIHEQLILYVQFLFFFKIYSDR